MEQGEMFTGIQKNLGDLCFGCRLTHDSFSFKS